MTGTRSATFHRMPWSYTIDSERDVVIGTATGKLTNGELLPGIAAVTRDSDYRRGMRFFLDYHGVTDFALTVDVVLQVAAYPLLTPQTRRSFWIGSGFVEAVLKLAKMSAKGEFEVFTDRTSALEWLNRGYPKEKWLT